MDFCVSIGRAQLLLLTALPQKKIPKNKFPIWGGISGFSDFGGHFRIFRFWGAFPDLQNVSVLHNIWNFGYHRRTVRVLVPRAF